MSDLTQRIVAEHTFPGGPGIAQGTKVIYPCRCGVPIEGSEAGWGRHLTEVTGQAALTAAASKVTEFATGLARGLNQFPAGTSDYIDGTNDTLADVVEALGKLARLIARGGDA